MADTFKFELVSPEKLLVSEDAEWAVIPGSEGEMTVLPQHAPVMSTLKPGVISVKQAGGGEERFAVFGGFVDILPDACTVLAESALPVSELNREEMAQRIEAVRGQIAAASSDEERASAEQFLHQLTTLEQAIIPA
ncbi:MAG: F0F1 ATP synthase subunit epsilon [Flavobacteriaceae bacterium]